MASNNSSVQELSLAEAAEHLLEECRMVLPGMQALFGFQLIAVFNNGFSEKLSTVEQYLHLLAIGMVAVAIAIIMGPAAYHRQINPREVTSRFLTISTRLLLSSMPLLALAISIDFYLIANIVLHSMISLLLAGSLLWVFVLLWFVLPNLGRRERARSSN